MIFVTVGTHEQPFNRLVEYMDHWQKSHNEKVVMQIGYSTYIPNYAEWKKFFPYDQMQKWVENARIIITHGGPSSFIMPLQVKKTPIVAPRIQKYNEHVNNHQLEFCREIEARMNTIIVVENINELEIVINNYEKLSTNSQRKSNNANFCAKLETIISKLL